MPDVLDDVARHVRNLARPPAALGIRARGHCCPEPLKALLDIPGTNPRSGHHKVAAAVGRHAACRLSAEDLLVELAQAWRGHLQISLVREVHERHLIPASRKRSEDYTQEGRLQVPWGIVVHKDREVCELANRAGASKSCKQVPQVCSALPRHPNALIWRRDAQNVGHLVHQSLHLLLQLALWLRALFVNNQASLRRQGQAPEPAQ
mmetsp:Transcript_133593/g.372434  ORF Transcript_133593/g.372434 Transcript_133593/m.372434 type:complete len:206 (-) Transcript_133593:97-714(-)